MGLFKMRELAHMPTHLEFRDRGQFGGENRPTKTSSPLCQRSRALDRADGGKARYSTLPNLSVITYELILS